MRDDTDGAYAGLVAARAPALLRLAVMLTGSRADGEDLLQSTLVRAQRHHRRIVAMDAPAAYLRQVMVSEHLDERRAAGRRPRLVRAPDDVASDVDPTAALAAHDQVWRWLATLPPRQRAVLALRFYEDLDDTEIAVVLGCSHATVRAHASKALAALRSHAHDQLEQEDVG